MRSASRAKTASAGAACGAAGSAAERPTPAVFARAVDLHDGLARLELPRRGDFLEQRLDVRAEELERLMTGAADEVEVPRVPVGVLELELAVAEIDAARDAGLDHPEQRPVDGGAADARVFATDQLDEFVRAEMAGLAQQDRDDQVPLAGSASAGGTMRLDKLSGRLHLGSGGPRD